MQVRILHNISTLMCLMLLYFCQERRSAAKKNYSCWRLLWCFWCGIMPFFVFLPRKHCCWIEYMMAEQTVNGLATRNQPHTCYSFYSHIEAEKNYSFQWRHWMHISPAVTLHQLNNSVDSCCFYLMSWTWNLLLYMKWVVFVLKLYNHFFFFITGNLSWHL